MICNGCSKDVEKENFIESNGTKICLDCDNNKNFLKSLNTEKFKELLSKYWKLGNFDRNNKNGLIKHIRSMLDDFADLSKNANEKALSWINEKEIELRKLLFTLKIETPEKISDELMLFTLVNEKTNHNLFVAFPRGDKRTLDIQLKWCQVFPVYMEGCTDENGNFYTDRFDKILEKISYLSPVIFGYAFSPEIIKEKEKNKFLTSLKGLSAKDLKKLHLNRKEIYFSECCQMCQNMIKSGEKNEKIVSEFILDCENPNCTNFWNKESDERKKVFDKGTDKVILFYLERLFIKKEKSAESYFSLPFIPHQFRYLGRSFSLRFSRTKNSNLNEIPTLFKISFSHESNILAKTFGDAIEYFYSNEMGKPSVDKIFQFKVELGNKPDISIFSESGWNERTIEMTESPLLTLTKRNEKGIIENYGDHKRYLGNFLVKKLKKWKDEGIDNINDKLKSLKCLESFEEINSVTREGQYYAIRFKKIPTFDDLIKNIIEAIRRKNKKNYNFDALWIFTPLSFFICIKDKKTGEVVKDKET